MVTVGGIESTLLKAKHGSDIRKSQLHHSNDLTYNDLLLMMRRIFKIKSSTSVILKYRDTDGDLITLTDDSDLLLAIRTEPNLYIEVFTDADDLGGQLSQLDGLLTNINELAKTLKRTIQTALHSTTFEEKSASPLVSPGIKHNESVAAIQPSVHEQVDNGHVSHLTNNFSSPRHIKHKFEEELTLAQPYKPPAQQSPFLNLLEDVPIDNNHEQYKGTPLFQPISQTPLQQPGFQPPPSSVVGFQPIGTPTPQFQLPQQAQFYKPPTSTIPGAGGPLGQQYVGPPPPGQPQQIPGAHGQFQPTGPTPPPTAFGAPTSGPGGFNPFARASQQVGSYVRPRFNNY